MCLGGEPLAGRKLHICFGDPARHMVHMRSGATVRWTINTGASDGDSAVFYMVRPLSAFVAIGTVTGEVWRENNRRNEWFGHHFAEVAELNVLRKPVPLSVVRSQLKNWAWLRQPRRSTVVPSEFSRDFLRLLDRSPKPSSAELSELEGLRTEVVRLVSSRSRRLRDQAYAHSDGLCAVCRQDFSKLLDGRGVRVLQVHHRRQLSAYNIPRQTRLSDLVVVCANCHLLLHLDSEKPLTVGKLQRLIGRGGRRGA
jgi:hypothetical protein